MKATITIILLAVGVVGCAAPKSVCKPETVDCRQMSHLTYAADQLRAIEQGCPFGVARSGHPFTADAPFEDNATGMPTDFDESMCDSAATDWELEICHGTAY